MSDAGRTAQAALKHETMKVLFCGVWVLSVRMCEGHIAVGWKLKPQYVTTSSELPLLQNVEYITKGRQLEVEDSTLGITSKRCVLKCKG